MTAHDILSRLQGVKGGRGQWTAQCPAHDDKQNSLSVAEGKDGRVLLHCHAGCTVDGITAALGLAKKDLFPETAGHALDWDPTISAGKKGYRAPVVATYDILDDAGKLLAQKQRRADKSFVWRRPDQRHGWIYDRKGVPHRLYVAGELTGAVLVCEGEKDADTLHRLGYNAASGMDGAGPGKWRKEYTEQLRGLSVCVFQDNDPVGRAYAAETCDALHGAAANVRLLDLAKVWPDIPEHGDVTDMVERFGPERSCELIVQLLGSTPEWTHRKAPVENGAAPPTLDTITAADLQKKDLPPIKFIVDKLLPIGLSILASPPKYGKSWMVLALCLAASTGKRFLGYTTHKCGCLYLALEDSQRRLKSRMNKLLAGGEAPAGFHFATVAGIIDNGLFAELECFLKDHPETGLIVIDTLQRVRGGAYSKEGAYATDYREVGALKAFADKHSVALLLVHHLRKMKDDGDPFNMISGTNGIMGAADTTMVLVKEKRGDDNAIFSAIGRDIESIDSVLRFNKATCYWENMGDVDLFARQQAERGYQQSPIVVTIKKLLERSPDGWTGTAQQLLEAGRFIAHTPLADSTQGLTNKLKGLDQLLFENDDIVHERKKNGSGGGKHKFYYSNVPQFEELEQTEIDPFSVG